jgi:hypothetical protein
LPVKKKNKPKPLFEKTVSAQVVKSLGYADFADPGAYASWPASKILLYEDKLVLEMHAPEKLVFEFPYKYVNCITLQATDGIGLIKFVRVIHHKPRVGKYVLFSPALPVFSAGLLEEIKRVSRKNKLGIKFK